MSSALVRRAASEIFGERLAPPWLTAAGRARLCLLVAGAVGCVLWRQLSHTARCGGSTRTPRPHRHRAGRPLVRPSPDAGATVRSSAVPRPRPIRPLPRLFQLWNATTRPGPTDPCTQAETQGLVLRHAPQLAGAAARLQAPGHPDAGRRRRGRAPGGADRHRRRRRGTADGRAHRARADRRPVAATGSATACCCGVRRRLPVHGAAPRHARTGRAHRCARSCCRRTAPMPARWTQLRPSMPNCRDWWKTSSARIISPSTASPGIETQLMLDGVLAAPGTPVLQSTTSPRADAAAADAG